MKTPQRKMRDWVREAHAAVFDVMSRSQSARAWALLQERDAEGNALGPAPYTDPALAEFTAAYQRDPDDIGVIHHLAIAHHARAWDWELQGDQRAAAEWEQALGFWRRLAASAEFWTGLKTKLLACHPEANPDWLADLRRDLLEYLLERHVAFVRHYCEGESPERAAVHVRIVKRAQIPPAVKGRLVEKVFAAMTGSVPKARASGDFKSALTTIERFLQLFPDYLPALRLYAEVAKEQLSPLSFKTHWNEIARLSDRVQPCARSLADHSELDQEPLARAALEELTYEFALRGENRGESLLAESDGERLDVADREAAAEAFDIGVSWSRLGARHCSLDSRLKEILVAALQGRSLCLYMEAQEVLQSNFEAESLTAAERLYREGIASLEEALDIAPDAKGLRGVLERFRDELAKLQSERLPGWFMNLEGL